MATPEASPRFELSAVARAVMSVSRPAPPSERGRSWRPCSATELRSSWRNETFMLRPFYRKIAPEGLNGHARRRRQAGQANTTVSRHDDPGKRLWEALGGHGAHTRSVCGARGRGSPR